MNRNSLLMEGGGRSKKEGRRPPIYDRKSEIYQKALDLFLKKRI
jgi:hypothetical protein